MIGPVRPEPIRCDVRWCDKGQGAAVAKYYCETEKRYICEEDIGFCNNLAHNWEELKKNEPTKEVSP
jgi:hypothetical protein